MVESNQQIDKHLNLLYILGYKCMEYKIFKILICFNCAFHMLITLVHIFFLVSNFNYEYFIKFLPFLMETIFGVQASITFMHIKDKLKIFHNTVKEFGRKLPQSGDEYNKIRLISQRINIRMIAILILALISAFCHMVNIFCEEDINDSFGIFLLNLFFKGNYLKIWSAIFYLSLLPLAFSMVVIGVYVPYVAAHVTFQLIILNQSLRNLFLSPTITSSTLFEGSNYNREYQRNVEKKIKLIISHHSDIKRMIRNGGEFLVVPIASNLSAGFLLYAAFIFLIINFSWYNVPRLVTMGLTGTAVLILAAQTGQILEDQSSAIFDTALQLPWYSWNKKNNKMLIVLLTNAATPMKISTVSLTINLTLLPRYLRLVFTLVTFMRHTLRER